MGCLWRANFKIMRILHYKIPSSNVWKYEIMWYYYSMNHHFKNIVSLIRPISVERMVKSVDLICFPLSAFLEKLPSPFQHSLWVLPVVACWVVLLENLFRSIFLLLPLNLYAINTVQSLYFAVISPTKCYSVCQFRSNTYDRFLVLDCSIKQTSKRRNFFFLPIGWDAFSWIQMKKRVRACMHL